MPNDNDGVIKNPLRNTQPTVQKYVPEYVRLGKQPVPMRSGLRDPSIMTDDQPIRPPGVSSLPASFLTNQKRGPNVPSPLETFDTFDDEIFAPNQNQGDEYIQNDLEDDEFVEPVFEPQSFAAIQNPQSEEQNSDTPSIGQYILMVQGKVIMTGDLSIVEPKIKHILYGEDKNYSKLSMDDIVVLKRVGLKVGVFVDE